MIRDLASQSDTSVFVIVSMLFFISVFVVVVVRLLRTDPAEARRHACLPLDDAESSGDDVETALEQEIPVPTDELR